MTDKAYVVTEGSYSDYRIVRVYLDSEDAERFVNAYNKAHEGSYRDGYGVEEYDIGCDAEYDGIGWVASWEGAPISEWGHNRSIPTQYRDNGEWRETESIRQTWLTGSAAKARVNVNKTFPSYRRWVQVEGTSREHVEKSLHDTVAQVKAERAGLLA